MTTLDPRTPAVPDPNDVVLRAEGISKVYGGTHALRGVDFSVRAGAVTALFGENGAGKSTLMKIIAGVERPTAGSLSIDGNPVEFDSSVDAVDHGVAIIHQELSLCPNLSVTDNIFMGRELLRRGPFVDTARQRRIVDQLMDRLEERIDPRREVGELRLGQQQIVEIARAISLDARVLIMDEPTSALSGTEVHVLFRVIRELTAAGVAVVYISHHLDEALEIADDVVVLRDGALVATAWADDVDLPWVVARMVGRNPEDLFPPMGAPRGKDLLEIRGLTVADPSNPSRLAVAEFNLTVRAGEVVSIYGLMGAGRTELLETLAGRLTPQAGQVLVDGADVTNQAIASRIALGLALVPEDRQRDGLIPSMTVGENVSLASITRFLRGPFLRHDDERSSVRDMVKDVTVKASGPDATIGSLSGGNQQKVVIAKMLLTRPDVLILDEPTRGIDVGAKADIFALMAEQARQGRAVLFATSELGEALHAADRVLVMNRGRLVQEFDPATTTQEDLMAASDDAAPPAGEPRASDLPAAPTTTTHDLNGASA